MCQWRRQVANPSYAQDYNGGDGDEMTAEPRREPRGPGGGGSGGKRPSWYVSSEILEPIITGTFANNDLNINFGYSIGKIGSLQVGLSLRDTKVEGDGTDRQAGDPDDQRPDATANQSSTQYRSFDIGYFQTWDTRKAGLRLGALFTFGSTETKSQDTTTIYSQDDAADFTETLDKSSNSNDFYAFTIRAEVEHHFNRFIAAGIMQDFVYQVGEIASEQTSSSRTYSGGVQTGIDDPTITKNKSDQTDVRTVFRGIYLRVYF